LRRRPRPRLGCGAKERRRREITEIYTNECAGKLSVCYT
jgi:hypothetical protein